MEAYNDHIGFKRLLLPDSGLFSFDSLAAYQSYSASELIASRTVLVVDSAMIVPTELTGIHQHNIALGHQFW